MLHIYQIHNYTVVSIATVVYWTVRISNNDAGKFFWAHLTAQRSIQPSLKWVPGTFPGINRMGCGVDYPPANSTEFKERVELYF